MWLGTGECNYYFHSEGVSGNLGAPSSMEKLKNREYRIAVIKLTPSYKFTAIEKLTEQFSLKENHTPTY